MNLHDLHRRRLESTVELIEAGLVRMERALLEASREGIVQALGDTLRSDERDRLMSRVRQLRDALAEFAKTFALQQRSLDVRQILNAEISTIWVMLENCRPKREGLRRRVRRCDAPSSRREHRPIASPGERLALAIAGKMILGSQ